MNIKNAFNTLRSFINKFNGPARIIRNGISLVALVAIIIGLFSGGGLDSTDLSVEKMDNGLIRMLKVASKSEKPITVKKITINNEFSPKIQSIPMSMGESYTINLNYPVRYKKDVFKVDVETDRGSVTYTW